MSVSKAVLSPQGIYYFALSEPGFGSNMIFSSDLNTGKLNAAFVLAGYEIDGLAFIDNTLYVSNGDALAAYTPVLLMKWSKPTGFSIVKGSNLIATQENGKNVLYYAATNTVFRFDTSTNNVTKYESPATSIIISSISYMGNGYLLVIGAVEQVKADFIYSVNVVKGTSLKLGSQGSYISAVSSCTSPLNVQSSQSATYSIISCGMRIGNERDKVVFGVLHDLSSKVPRFESTWHFLVHADSVSFASTQSDRQILMTNDSGYVILDIQSGKTLSEKKTDIANSLCKVITALNGKFYSVCSRPDQSFLSIASDHL